MSDLADSSTVYLCGICRQLVDWDAQSVMCEACDTWYHLSCQAIPSNQYSLLGHSSVHWSCKACNSGNYTTTSPAMLYEDTIQISDDNSINTSEEVSIESLDEQQKPIHESSPKKFRPPPAKRGRPLRVINVNCQSINGKKGAWINMLNTTRPDVIIATETWLDSTISSSELESDDFTIYRRDRKAGRGGGVMIAVNSSITSTEVSIRCEAEILWVKIQCIGHRDIYIAACYRPNISDKNFTTHLKSSLNHLVAKRPKALLIGGDFNLPGFDWSDITIKPGTQYPALHTEFRDLLDDFGLTQSVIEPTRLTNTLDLVATNIPEQVNRVKTLPGISDHSIVFIEVAVSPNYRKQIPRKVWLYSKADWEGMANYMRPRLEIIDNQYQPSPDDHWTMIKELILEAMTIYIPQRQTRRKDSRPWINKQLHRLIRKKNQLYKRCKKRGTLHLEKRYNMYRHAVQKMLRKQHADYVHRLFTDESKSKGELSKRFWTYVKHRRSAAVSSIGPLKRGTLLVTDAKERAQILNEQFVSVFSRPSSPTNYAEHTLHAKMKEIVFDTNGIHKQLVSLKANKAAGPDGIGPRVLKEMADVLAKPLTTLFQSSLDTGKVPQDWKTASVCPVYKKGEKYLAENYRPVSLTCITSKIMEHIITSQLQTYAEDNNIFYSNQHGFRANRGCELQLTELVTDITYNLDAGKETEVCVLDFSKAFDKVNHQKLLLKLANCGVNFKVVSWIEDFLTGRQQKVVVEGEESPMAAVTSGVPQGSVIGPTMFLFYINDLPDNIKSVVRLFADDTVVYNTTDNHQLLQDDLQRLAEWEARFDMEFHPMKCQHMTFSRKRIPDTQSLTLHGTVIPRAYTVKYLGATLDPKVTWSTHVDNITAKANSTVGFIRRNVLTTSQSIKEVAYKQLVRPVLEYASTAWDSITDTHANRVEAVQRRAARMICGIRRTDHKTSTTSLLQQLNLQPLAKRRGDRRLKVFSQYHHGNQAILLKYIKKAEYSSARRHQHQYFLPQTNTDHCRRSFFIRTSKEWNVLPASSPLLSAAPA